MRRMKNETLYFNLFLVLFRILFANDKIKSGMSSFQGIAYSLLSIDRQFRCTKEFGQMDTTKQDFLMKLAKKELTGLYYAQGYFSADINLEIQREYYSLDSAQRGYLFYITEGPQYTLDSIHITVKEGNRELEINKHRLKSNKKSAYNSEAIIEDLEYIKSIYRKEGYLHTTIDYNELLDTLQHVVMLQVRIDPKTQVLMGKIKSKSFKPLSKSNTEAPQEEGLSDTSWLNSLWRIPSESLIDGEQFSSFKNKLFSTQLFTQIKLEDSLRADGFSDVHLQVIERVQEKQSTPFSLKNTMDLVVAQAFAIKTFGSFHNFRHTCLSLKISKKSH